MALFEDRITVARPVEVVFDFLTTASNIEKVSQADLGLTFLETPEKYHHGAVIKFQIMGMGQVRTAVHEVIEFDSPERFVERQIEGALKLWVHEHLFESDGDQTHIVDRITFEPPGGFIGMLITPTRISDGLERGFDHRHRMLKRLLENEAH